jgi:flagellar biosynthesis/type III secretory pathway protein FliH
MRRDIMRESIAYDLIKEEGLKEGLQQGLEKGFQQGLEKGLKQGLEKGMLEEARETVLEGLVERFKVIPGDMEKAIGSIESRILLRELHRAIFRAKNLEQFRKLLDKARQVH